MATGDEHARRLAKNEALFREVNEAIERIASEHGDDPHLYEFLCECSDRGCTDPVRLTIREYEQVRAKGDRFAIVAGHEDTEVEAVVERFDRYVLVEKHGEASKVAVALDPRT
jgi:hypothetical protein